MGAVLSENINCVLDLSKSKEIALKKMKRGGFAEIFAIDMRREVRMEPLLRWLLTDDWHI